MFFKNFFRSRAVKKETTRLLGNVKARYSGWMVPTPTGFGLIKRCDEVRRMSGQLRAALKACRPEHITMYEGRYTTAKQQLAEYLSALDARSQRHGTTQPHPQEVPAA